MTALRFLHVGISNKNISSCFHRDIKSANIVLKQDLTAQLIDCGLAKFVVEDVETQSSGSRKGTPGYICPEYSIGGVPFDCSCDVYSFGVVLLELWTGRLQNHKDEDGNPFNFVLQYLPGRKGPKRDVKADLDPTFGMDSTAMPDYMTRFVELALSCMDEHDEIPSGEVVMNELVDILHACAVEEKDFASGAVTENPTPEVLGQQLCDRCLSFPKMLNGLYCRLCCDAERQRHDIQEILSRLRTIGTETSAANAKLDSMAPVLGNLDARISSTIPRLFFIIPATSKHALRHPREYLRSRVATNTTCTLCVHIRDLPSKPQSRLY
jgi:serine/threonine protein kinase